MCAKEDMEEGPPIDWDDAFEAGEGGRLMELLVSLPRAHWAERDEDGDSSTLLHLAGHGHNVQAAVALVQSKLTDLNARNNKGWTPAYDAAAHTRARVLEVLCAAGADVRASDSNGNTPIDRALKSTYADGGDTVRVLLASGVRLSTVRSDVHNRIALQLKTFERGVLRCRSAVVAILRVKKAGKLWQWDKFLLRELAYAVWATRYDEKWQN